MMLSVENMKKLNIVLLLSIMLLCSCSKNENDEETLRDNSENDNFGVLNIIKDVDTEEDLLQMIEEKDDAVLFQYSNDTQLSKVIYLPDSGELNIYREEVRDFTDKYYSSTDETILCRESDQDNYGWSVYFSDEIVKENIIIEAEEKGEVSWYKDSYVNYNDSEIKVLYNFSNEEKKEGGFCIITIPFSEEAKQTEQYINTFSVKKLSDGSSMAYYPGNSKFLKAVLTENTIYFTDDYNKNVLCELDIETGKITHWEDMLEELAIYAEPYDGIICDIQPFAYKEGYLLVRILFGEKEVSKAKFAVYTEAGELVSIFSE